MHPSGENRTESFCQWGDPFKIKASKCWLDKPTVCQIQGGQLDFFHPSGAGWLQHKAPSLWCGWGRRLMHHSDVSCNTRQCAVWSFRPFSEEPRRTAAAPRQTGSVVAENRPGMCLEWKRAEWHLCGNVKIESKKKRFEQKIWLNYYNLQSMFVMYCVIKLKTFPFNTYFCFAHLAAFCVFVWI